MDDKDLLIAELREALAKAIQAADDWCDDSRGYTCSEEEITPRMRELAKGAK